MSDAAPLDLLVVGAGLTGLAAAWRARQAGRSVLLLEAAPRVGGVIRTDRVGGYRVERAAASFPSNATHLLDLHASLPAASPVHVPSPDANAQHLLTRRGLVALPKSPPAFFASPLLSFGAKARLFVEATRGPRHGRSAESAWQFVRRRFGRGVADGLLKPMTLGIYGTAPEDLGLADAFPALADLEREHGSLIRGMARKAKAARAEGTPRTKRAVWVFEDGMESLPRAIAAALGEAARTGVPVASLERNGDLVRVRGGDGVARLARRVVLATTAPEQARLVEPLSPAAAAILSGVRYVPMVVVAVGVPPGGSPPIPKSFGFLRAPGAGVRILGASFPSCLNPAVAPEGHALISVFVGGGQDPGAVDLSDDALTDVVVRDLSKALCGPVRPDMVSVHRWARAIPVLSPGHRSRMAAAQALLAPHGVFLSGSHRTGVGVHACAAPIPGQG